MGIVANLRDAFSKRSGKNTASQEVSGQLFCNSLCSSYENAFAQTRALVDELKTVRPYGIGRNGARLPINRTPELAVLDYPNEEMGWAEFADLMFVTWLTEPELNIHVWQKGNKNVYGYTILPRNSKRSLGNGDYYFQVTTINNETFELTRDEVMTLRFSRSPHDFSKGVSPVSAVEIWSQIDDLIAQYQKAFFENGAVPAYVTIIRARTKETYERKRRELEGGLKGAQNRHKTIYIWRNMREDGTEADEVEVKTIQGNNATLAIQQIMQVVDNKINKAFGVSNFIMGDDSSAKYDNAELSDRQFTKRRVYPALVSFWGQFQHELDRILGGLGYAISFDLEIPELTDRLKVKSEISGNNVKNLTNLITAGAPPKAAVRALELNKDWENVAFGIFDKKRKEEEQAQIQAGAQMQQLTAITETTESTTEDMNENTDSVHIPKSDMNTLHDHHDCEHCHTHDAVENYEPSFSTDEVVEKLIYGELLKLFGDVIARELGEGVELDEDDLLKIVQTIYEALIDEANNGADTSAKQIRGYLGGKEKLEVDEKLKNGGYKLDQAFQERLQKRTQMLVERFDEYAGEQVKEIMLGLAEEPLTKVELQKKLEAAMPKGRAELIARNETAYALRAGQLENAKDMARRFNLKVTKTWDAHIDDNTCDICRAMNGQTVELDSAWKDSGERTVDGETIEYTWEQNDWNEHGEIPSAHPRCRCTMRTEVVKDD